jgi:hypothetical protein
MATVNAQAAERAQNAALPTDIHVKSKVQRVKLDELKTDRSYQRDISMPLVETIRNQWDMVASELLLVSRRDDGDLYIVNGQHRSAAARMNGMTELDARVVEGLNPAQEAALRLMTNVRKSDSPLERFRAQIAAGDPDSLAIEKLLDRVGTHVNIVPSADEGINAISTVEQIYRWDDGATLQETLEFLQRVFGTVGGKRATAPILHSVAWFILKHGQEATLARIEEQLKGMGPAAFTRRGQTTAAIMGGTLWVNCYRTLVELYNDGLGEKSRLAPRTGGAAREAAGGPRSERSH